MTAYGALKLKPHEFWALTPREFCLMCVGHFRHEREGIITLAWWTAALAGSAMMGGLPPLDELLDPVDKSDPDEVEKRKQDYKAIRDKVGHGVTKKDDDEAALKKFIKETKGKAGHGRNK